MLILLKNNDQKWVCDKRGNPMRGAITIECPWTLEQLLEYRQVIQTWIDKQGDQWMPGHGGIAEQSRTAFLWEKGMEMDEINALLREPAMDDSGLRNPSIGAYVLWGDIKVRKSVVVEGFGKQTTKWSKPIKGITVPTYRNRGFSIRGEK